jgi:hypothetical protein
MRQITKIKSGLLRISVVPVFGKKRKPEIKKRIKYTRYFITAPFINLLRCFYD